MVQETFGLKRCEIFFSMRTEIRQNLNYCIHSEKLFDNGFDKKETRSKKRQRNFISKIPLPLVALLRFAM